MNNEGNIEHLKTQIRVLRGAPLTLFFTLVILGGFATKSRLAAITGYSLPTIRSSMASLAEYGWATELRGGWQLTQHGLQISMDLGRQPVDNSVKKFFSPTTATESFNQEEDLSHANLAVVEAAENIFSPEEQARRDALWTAYIGEPTLTELGALPDLDPDYIRAMAVMTKDDGLGTGMLVHRLRSRDELRGKYRLKGICPDCGRPRFDHNPYCIEAAADAERIKRKEV